MSKIILDLCGGTGAWSKPYAEHGYDVRNITLPEHDVRTFKPPENVYGILAAPPCPQFSFARMRGKKKRDLELGMEIVRVCLEVIWKCQCQYKSEYQKKSPLTFWCLENPNGWLKFFLGKPVFEFNPYDFGDNYKKKTHLWGWFNKPYKHPIICDKPKFDRMKSKDIHSEYYGIHTREIRRAITPTGFSIAFFEANQ